MDHYSDIKKGFSAEPELAGRRVTVAGLGRTGLAMVDFLLGKGALVTATDAQTADKFGPEVTGLADRGVTLELGGHGEEAFAGADLIVLSPGVPATIGPLRRAMEKGVPVTGEIELASRFVRAPIAAVTGTNGKTTTTSLLGEILRRAGRRVFVGGNIGNPLIGHVRDENEADVVVIEVSSFQLETAVTLKPGVAVLLNVTPDHLDRYAGFDAYTEAKARVFARQDGPDTAVMNYDDPVVRALAVPARRRDFSRLAALEEGAFLRDRRIILMENGHMAAELPLEDLNLVGAHNQENVMAALLAARALGVDPETACRAAADFQGLAHRVEFVAEIGGVRYYDDSKGTNVGAVIKSLEGFDSPVILIAGGRDKAGDFTALAPLVREKVKLLILLGEAKHKIAEALGGETETALAGDMAEAVSLARSRAAEGDVVLLSPACASFDMFRDYGHRGRVFAGLVKGEAV